MNVASTFSAVKLFKIVISSAIIPTGNDPVPNCTPVIVPPVIIALLNSVPPVTVSAPVTERSPPTLVLPRRSDSSITIKSVNCKLPATTRLLNCEVPSDIISP